MNQSSRVATLLTAMVLALGDAAASQVRQVNLEQMTDRAARIFAGTCVDSRVEMNEDVGRSVLVTTFSVQRTIKGDAGETVTLKMIAVEGQAQRFAAGEDVVLFLYGESQLGLSSPVGFGQGSFKVIADKQGRRVALNELGNANLLRGLTPQAEMRLGSAFEQWKERKDLDSGALLDMAAALVNDEER